MGFMRCFWDKTGLTRVAYHESVAPVAGKPFRYDQCEANYNRL